MVDQEDALCKKILSMGLHSAQGVLLLQLLNHGTGLRYA